MTFLNDEISKERLNKEIEGAGWRLEDFYADKMDRDLFDNPITCGEVLNWLENAETIVSELQAIRDAEDDFFGATD